MPAALCSNQQLFDAAINGLIAQGKRAYENKSCRYRTSSGLACAVGQLIPDSRYSKRIESHVPRLKDFGLDLGLLTTGCQQTDRFLHYLQDLHDEKFNQPIEHWLEPIEDFALSHHLHTKNINL
jgi:hypothetical protein